MRNQSQDGFFPLHFELQIVQDGEHLFLASKSEHYHLCLHSVFANQVGPLKSMHSCVLVLDLLLQVPEGLLVLDPDVGGVLFEGVPNNQFVPFRLLFLQEVLSFSHQALDYSLLTMIRRHCLHSF